MGPNLARRNAGAMQAQFFGRTTDEQQALARQGIQDAGFSVQVTVALQDYRAVECEYDAVVSVEGGCPRCVMVTRHIDDELPQMDPKFVVKKSLVIWGDQMIRRGFLRPLERLLLHSPLMVWAPVASNVYHDMIWYPTVGRARIGDFMRTEWGTLFKKY